MSSKYLSKKTERIVRAPDRKSSIPSLVMILLVYLLILPACTSDLPALAPTLEKTVAQPEDTQTPVPLAPSITKTPSMIAVVKTQPPAANPLTGLAPDSPELLDRRPLIIKIENLPRNNRRSLD